VIDIVPVGDEISNIPRSRLFAAGAWDRLLEPEIGTRNKRVACRVITRPQARKSATRTRPSEPLGHGPLTGNDHEIGSWSPPRSRSFCLLLDATRFRQPRGEGTAAAAPFAVAPGLELAAHTGIMANEPDHHRQWHQESGTLPTAQWRANEDPFDDFKIVCMGTVRPGYTLSLAGPTGKWRFVETYSG